MATLTIWMRRFDAEDGKSMPAARQTTIFLSPSADPAYLQTMWMETWIRPTGHEWKCFVSLQQVPH